MAVKFLESENQSLMGEGKFIVHHSRLHLLKGQRQWTIVARNRNRKLQTSKAPLKSQAQGTSLFTSAASNQRGFPKNSPWEAQVRFPEGERMRQIRGVFQRI